MKTCKLLALFMMPVIFMLSGLKISGMRKNNYIRECFYIPFYITYFYSSIEYISGKTSRLLLSIPCICAIAIP